MKKTIKQLKEDITYYKKESDRYYNMLKEQEDKNEKLNELNEKLNSDNVYLKGQVQSLYEVLAKREIEVKEVVDRIINDNRLKTERFKRFEEIALNKFLEDAEEKNRNNRGG